MPADPLTTALTDGMPLLVLSPHLDDAVLSCGALLSHACGRVPVTVVTLFTECAPPPHTLSARQYLRQIGVADAERLYQARRAEDRTVLEGMRVEWLHAGLTDALFRRKPERAHGEPWPLERLLPELTHLYPTYRLHISSGHVAPGDAETLERILGIVRVLSAQGPGLLLAPLGIGGHVDHVLVRTAAELSGQRAVYYNDFPYRQRYAVDAGFVRRNSLAKTTWFRELQAKPALVRGYRTQAHALFPGGRVPLAPEVYLFPAAAARRATTSVRSLR
jgi:LmbE family N-acetylglucosaminyl deacetylase